MKNNKSYAFPLALKILIPLIFGIMFGWYTKLGFGLVDLGIFLVGLLILTFVVLVKKWNIDWVFGWLSITFFFLLGLHLVDVNNSMNHSRYFYGYTTDHEAFYQLRLIDDPIEKTNSFQLLVEVQTVNDSATYGDAIVYLAKGDKASSLKYGDVIYGNLRFQNLNTPVNPNTFDYAAYMALQDVYHQGYIANVAWEKIGADPNIFYKYILSIQSNFKKKLSHYGLEGKNKEVANALLLGDKSHLEFETRDAFAIAGAMHVLAVSGLHVGIVMLIVSFLFKPIKKWQKGKWVFVALVVLVIWFYALITGMSPSVMRSALMFSFVVVGKEFERNTSIYQSIIISAFILILINPLVIFHVGFQLSYIAVLGIVYLQPKIYNLFYTDYWLIDKIWQITAVSLAAQLATFPLGLYYFHQFPNYFLIANLAVIPLAFVILFVGILFFTFSWVPLLNDFLFALLDFVLSILNYAVGWIGSLPFAAMKGVSFGGVLLICTYILIGLMIIAFTKRKKHFFISGLLMLSGVLFYQLFQKHQQEEINRLFIYSLNNAVGIDLFYGKENQFIANQELLARPDEIDYQIKPNWIYYKSKDYPTETLILDEKTTLISFGDYKMQYIDKEILEDLEKEGLLKTDLVYLNDLQFVPIELIDLIRSNNSLVILGNEIKYGTRKFIKSKLLASRTHDLKSDGAFEMEF